MSHKLETDTTPERAATGREYARAFARSVLGRGDVALSDSDADRVAYAISRVEELENPARDEWGNWEYRFSELGRAQQPPRPWVDEMLVRIPKPPSNSHQPATAWPDRHPFAVCLTHDVDAVSSRSHGRRFFRRLGRIATASGPKGFACLLAAGSLYRLATGIGSVDKLGNFEKWLEVEAQYGFHSTWYFLPSSYARAHVYDMDYRHTDPVLLAGRRATVSGMMREIRAAGCEVGLHGSYHSARSAVMLRDQREQVEHALGAPVRSVRQHYLQYDSSLTPAIQEAAGCDSDSTQGFNTSIGFRAGTSFPYRAWDHQSARPSGVLEIPMHVMDGPLMRASSNDIDQAVQNALKLMDWVERVGGCLTVNWHPNNIGLPGYMKVYSILLKEAAARGAWGCSAADVTEWWFARERRTQAETAGKTLARKSHASQQLRP